MNNKDIEVPNYVIQAFIEVRESGKTNMFDSNQVLYYMYEFGHYDAVCWLGEVIDQKVYCNNKRYAMTLREYSDIFRVAQELS